MIQSVELRRMTNEELIQIEEKSRAELFALRFQASMGNLEKPHRIKELKILIARTLTALSERKLAGEIINRNIKVDISKTFQQIEHDTRKLFKKRRQQAEKLMKQQSDPKNMFLNNNLETNNVDITNATNTIEHSNSDLNLISKPTTKKTPSTNKQEDVKVAKPTTKKTPSTIKTEKLKDFYLLDPVKDSSYLELSKILSPDIIKQLLKLKKDNPDMRIDDLKYCYTVVLGPLDEKRHLQILEENAAKIKSKFNQKEVNDFLAFIRKNITDLNETKGDK